MDSKISLLGRGLVVLNFLVVLIFHFNLPDVIPTHFNIKGEADAYGEKSTLWTLPIISAALYFGLLWIAKHVKPWHYNYPVKVTEKNASKLYGQATRMLLVLGVSVALVFLIISLYIILLTRSVNLFPNGWILTILTIALPVLPMFYYAFKMFKTPKE